MAWAIVFAAIAWVLIPKAKRGGKLILPLIMILGILPDIDILLGNSGILHRTVTHSLLTYSILFIPFFFVFNWKAVPYFVAVISHFVFGDILIGQAALFWPLKHSFIGFNFTQGSLTDIALETTGLLIAAGIIIYNGDLRQNLSVQKRNLLNALPLLAIVVSGLFFANHWPSLNSFFEEVFSNNLLIVLALGHLVLIGFLSSSAFLGLKAFFTSAKGTRTIHHPKPPPTDP
jgi:hypothetical protein